MGMPEIVHGRVVEAQGRRLLALDDLPEGGVIEVRTDEHGVIAVGIADGTPFAVSNVCRHQFAKLGRGQVRDGCLECPWHRARYDLRTGAMVQGPQGRIWGFPPYSEAVRQFGSRVAPLKVFDVVVRGGAIWLT